MEESVRPLNFSVGTMRNNDEGKVPEEARRRERAEALSERPIERSILRESKTSKSQASGQVSLDATDNFAETKAAERIAR